MARLFVGGIPYEITTNELEDLFKQFGQVTSVFIATDKVTGRSKGFGFVEMSTDEEAENAIKQLDGTDVSGRAIKVAPARPREERSDSNFQRNNDYRKGR